jgi:hypothetical protein
VKQSAQRLGECSPCGGERKSRLQRILRRRKREWRRRRRRRRWQRVTSFKIWGDDEGGKHSARSSFPSYDVVNPVI